MSSTMAGPNPATLDQSVALPIERSERTRVAKADSVR